MTGLCLIPAVASLACGLTCAIHMLHGEPTTSIAVVGLFGVGAYSTWQTLRLAYTTESLGLEFSSSPGGLVDGSPQQVASQAPSASDQSAATHDKMGR